MSQRRGTAVLGMIVSGPFSVTYMVEANTGPMDPATTRIDDSAYRKASGKFQQSWMSNAKWRKVLTAIASTDSGVTRCEYKCIDNDAIVVERLPRLSDIASNRFADGAYQPFAYKWIEWFRFQRRFKPHAGVGLVVEQNVERLKAEIETVASAMMKLDEAYLWLYGYTGETVPRTPQGPAV